jgi:ATP-dependent DNA ligase
MLREATLSQGLEGIVSKRLGSPYRSGRSRDWIKMKNPNVPLRLSRPSGDCRNFFLDSCG